jgi:hypothetical protein
VLRKFWRLGCNSGSNRASRGLETVNTEFDACIFQATCKIAVQQAEDLTFGFLGAAEEEEAALIELVQLGYSGAGYGDTWSRVRRAHQKGPDR